MEFCRIADLEVVRLVLTSPGIYPFVGDDYSPPAEEFQANDHPGIWYVGVYSRHLLIGMFTLIPQSQVCWELHAAMLPCATTRDKWEAARGLPPWLAEHTTCRRLTAAVPATNGPAMIYGTHGLGMRYVGRHARAFMKHGWLQDLVLLGLSIGG